MAKTYRSYLPEQSLLLPPDLRDWLPDDHLAYFVSELVDELDLGAIESYYEAETRGQPPYHPRLMVKLLVYGYCLGVRSSRKIARRVDEDIAFASWRRIIGRTFAPSRIFARSISRHSRRCSNRCCDWRWKPAR